MTHLKTENTSPKNSSRKKWLSVALGGTLVVVVCVGLRMAAGGPEKAAAVPPTSLISRQAPAETSRKASTEPEDSSDSKATAASKYRTEIKIPAVVAEVNGKQVSREELAQECLRHYGKEVLESMVNKYLILSECHRRNITVTDEEVDQEIERMAARFSIPVDQWMKMLMQERGIKPQQYAEDIIWPTLALRKLANKRLEVTQKELVHEFEIQYGPSVRARLIACDTQEKADKIHTMAVQDPESFGNLAKNYSIDTASAAAKGVIPPIRMHGTYEAIESVAFSMPDGEISPVIQAENQFVIIKREELIPGRKIKLEQVAPQLEEIIRERKMRTVANDIFQELQKDAQVENVMNDPQKSRQEPGVAATINGKPIALRQVAEECIKRHGTDVLEGTINRTLLSLECQKRKIEITDADLDAEIARAALLNVAPNKDGSPNIEEWLNMVTTEQNVSVEVYRHDAVWPSVALRKLAGEKVDVSEEDLKKGFEANFGPRVRCLAIVSNNARRAQEVFEKARNNNTSEFFGELAAQYSVEPSSQALRGEVPPIKKWGGQPLLEREAFMLKPGEISGTIQVGDKFVVLRCEGYTKPANVKFEAVRSEIYKDLFEKKLHLNMEAYFDKIQSSATIENYLAGTSQSPKTKPAPATGMNIPTMKQVPAKRG